MDPILLINLLYRRKMGDVDQISFPTCYFHRIDSVRDKFVFNLKIKVKIFFFKKLFYTEKKKKN